MKPRLEKSIELYNILLRRGYLEPFCDEVSKKSEYGWDGTMPAAIYGIGKFPNNAPVFGASLSLLRQLFYEQGKSVSAIAAETGHDRKTISQYLDMTDFNTPEPNEYHGAAGPGIIQK